MKTSSKIRVFLADDTLIAREGWKKILETADDIMVIGEAANAHEASQKISSLHPDIVLMDLKWFGDDTAGQAAIKEIKSLSVKPRVIAVTAYENLIHDARVAGADAALTKTFSREELLNLIRVLVSRQTSFQTPEETTLLSTLTQREQEVLQYLSKGHSDKEIAKIMGIAPTTVKNHVKNLREKLGAKNRTQAADMARDMGLIR